MMMKTEIIRYICDVCKKEESSESLIYPNGWFKVDGRYQTRGDTCSRVCLIALIEESTKKWHDEALENILKVYDKEVKNKES